MPYFPKDDGITLTLHNGETVTLFEKNLTVDERKNITKRSLSLQYDFKYKERQGKAIDARIEQAGMDKDAFDKATGEAVELVSSITAGELYGIILPMRFASWDVFASKADFESNKPVAMTTEAIAAFAAARIENTALLEEIFEKLTEYDKREEKKDLSVPADGGNGFTATAVS